MPEDAEPEVGAAARGQEGGATRRRWAERLAAAVDAGDVAAARRLASSPPADREARDGGLDVLAHRAAAGTPLALELLAELVDELGLARAGVRQVLADRYRPAVVLRDIERLLYADAAETSTPSARRRTPATSTSRFTR